MADIRNIRRNGDNTPSKICRCIGGNLHEIKRVYKGMGSQAVIVWDIGTEELKKMLVIFFSSGYSSVTVPPLETTGHTGSITVKQGSISNYDIIGEYEYNSAESFYKSSLSSKKLTFVEIYLPDIAEIKNEAFKNNIKIMSFSATSDSKIARLGKLSFGKSTTMGNSSKLTTVSLPDTITVLDDECFQFTSSLTSFRFPASLQHIGKRCFHGGGLYGNISLPPSVKTIGAEAFDECSRITSISIGSGITDIAMSINGSPFTGCTKLTQIFVAENNYYKAENNKALFNKSGTELIYYATGAADTFYSVPETVQMIKNKAFSGNISLNKISISENVVSIGNSAFSGCTGLTSMTLPNSVEADSCGSGIFHGCTSLNSLSLPAAWSAIPSGLCENCTALKNITLPSAISKICSGAFKNSGLTEIVIPESVQEIQSYAFADCKNLKTIRYSGTQEEWGNINIGAKWLENTDAEIAYSS